MILSFINDDKCILEGGWREELNIIRGSVCVFVCLCVGGGRERERWGDGGWGGGTPNETCKANQRNKWQILRIYCVCKINFKSSIYILGHFLLHWQSFMCCIVTVSIGLFVSFDKLFVFVCCPFLLDVCLYIFYFILSTFLSKCSKVQVHGPIPHIQPHTTCELVVLHKAC